MSDVPACVPVQSSAPQNARSDKDDAVIVRIDEPKKIATDAVDCMIGPAATKERYKLKRPIENVNPAVKGAIVGYVRVSTQRQGRSGLGLEAQLAAIETFARENGLAVIAVYREVESGRIADRPQLAAALAHARKAKARLVIAKLDRLARNVAFVSTIMDSGVEFTAVDNPTATRLTLHILAAVAEHEAEMISARTKAALAAAKARGVKLGSPVARMTASAARASRTAKAQARAQNLVAIVRDIEHSGIVSLSGVARALEARGVQTPRGSTKWQPGQVARLRATAV